MLARNVLTTLALLATGIAQQLPLISTVQAMSPAQREALLLELYASMDVVDLMRVTGHDTGGWLDDERVVRVFGEPDGPRRMTEGDKLRLKRAGRAFMDVTDHPDLGALNALRPYQPRTLRSVLPDSQAGVLRAAMDVLDDGHLRADIAVLSAFWNRGWRSEWGRRSSDWVYAHVQEILANGTSSSLRTSVRKFAHDFPQTSTIARLEAADDDTEDKELIIIGAHQDSLNYKLPFYRAPGADDDGSGSVTIMHVLRATLEHFVPPKGLAVEFHWYAGEEAGLLGSQDVAAEYERSGAKVKGMLQMDMTAFVKNGTTPIVAFFKDAVDTDLTHFATSLVERYIPLPWNLTSCGPRCGSDHMSWTTAGYPAIFATEGLFDDGPFETIHSADDDTNNGGQYSFEHMLQFVKLGIAFIVELAAA